MSVIPINIALNVCAIIFYVFLIVIYLTKKNAHNLDNKLFRCLLLSNFLNLFLHLGYLILGFQLPESRNIENLITKLYLTSLLFYFIFLGAYIVIVTNEHNKNFKVFINKHLKGVKIAITLILLFFAFVQMILPVNVDYVGNGLISSGIGINVFTVLAALFFLVSGLSIFFNRKNVNHKKFIPFYSLDCLALVALILSSFYPTLCIMVILETLITFLMYHTIENPDMRQSAELRLAKEAAEKANNAKTDFLSSMSHELRTPLNAIVGLSQMIKTSDNLNEIHNDSNDIIIASQNLLDLVNSILDINKLESSKVEITETNYNPKELFNDLSRLIKIRIGNKPIELRTNFSLDLPFELYGDREKIKQIITNLLTNAVKYTEKGFIDFNVSCINEKDKCQLKIVVKDTGRGIQESQKEFLFNKFYRLEEDRDSDIQGTGLGLAITKSLVDLFNGKIEVDTKYGFGSTFTVTISQKISNVNSGQKNINNNLKDTNNIVNTTTTDEVLEINESKPEQLAPNEEKKQSVTNDINVISNNEPKKGELLIVDDNKLNLKVAAKLLQGLNYDIETVQSGYECIDKIKTDKKYDLIFMDIMMPNMNGVETMHKLKSLIGFNTPIVALTADATEGSRDKYLAEGFDEYVSKPVVKNIMAKVISKFIST